MKLTLLLAAVCVAASFPAFGASVTLIPVADTTISEADAFTEQPGTLGVGRLSVASGDGAVVRSLVRFDVSSLPTNAIVESVAVAFTVTFSLHSSPDTHRLHALTVPWSEASATWVNSGLAPWGGGTVESEADATTVFPGPVPLLPETATFASTPELVARVQSWIGNPAANYGWLLRNNDEETFQSARRLGSRENTISSLRPQLTVTYSVPGGTGPTLENAGVVAGKFRFTFNGAAGQSYTVRAKPVLAPGGWSTVTNIPTLGSPGVILVEDPLTASNRFYQVVSP